MAITPSRPAPEVVESERWTSRFLSAAGGKFGLLLVAFVALRSLAKIDCPIRGQECYNSIDMQNPILQVIKAKYTSLEPVLDERARRLWAGAEARAIGRGG